MDDLRIIKRKIYLKRQGRNLIGDEIIDLQIQMALVVHKSRLEAQIGANFDSVLSRKLDCINYLIEN
jgi:hypothetical protein